MVSPNNCVLAHGDKPGLCAWCGNTLTGKRRRWCSTKCSNAWANNHYWRMARKTAKRRDKYRCVQCGRGPKDYRRPKQTDYATRAEYLAAYGVWKPLRDAVRLEVDHIDPLWGRGYHPGCEHHLDNLRTLCHSCHVAVTNAAAR